MLKKSKKKMESHISDRNPQFKKQNATVMKAKRIYNQK